MRARVYVRLPVFRSSVSQPTDIDPESPLPHVDLRGTNDQMNDESLYLTKRLSEDDEEGENSSLTVCCAPIFNSMFIFTNVESYLSVRIKL